MTKETFTLTFDPTGDVGALRLPFDPKARFGKARPPVKVTLNGYTYRSTVMDMGDGPFVPLRDSNRQAAGLTGLQTLQITLELDTESREVIPTGDLADALDAANAWEGWRRASFTHQKEYAEAVETAKRPETKAKRIEAAVAFAKARSPN